MNFPPLLRRKSQAAFTAPELLICVLLIAVLCILSLGGMRAIRLHAQTTQCLALQRQIVGAIIIYSGEHNGWLPPYYDEARTTWGAMVAPYLGVRPGALGYREMRCPTAATEVSTTIGVNYSQQRGKAPFGISFAPFPGSMKLSQVSPGTVLTADIENPSGHVWFLSPNEFPLTLDSDGDGIKDTLPGNPPGNYLVFRHRGDAIVSLADGSARTVNRRQWGLNENQLWGP